MTEQPAQVLISWPLMPAFLGISISRFSLSLLACALAVAPAFAQIITHVPLYTFHGDSAGDRFGQSVSGAGDVNGDGFDDLIVGVPNDNSASGRGSALVVSGVDGSVLYDFDGDDLHQDSEPNDSFAFGFSVSGAGDVNGDGFADLIVGDPGESENGTNSGSIRVLSGANGNLLRILHGELSLGQFGGSVSDAGDVNGDGVPDQIVGAPLHSSESVGNYHGRAFVLSGAGGVLYAFSGDTANDQFGISVSGAGDVNGDGFADLIVGDSGGINGFRSGRAQVFSGADGSVLYTFNGDRANDNFGRSVSDAGDVNGDGFADFIVGAPFGTGDNGFDSGIARVFSGVDGSVLYTFGDFSSGGQFGNSVSGAGDVNGDGFADLIIGGLGTGTNNGLGSGRAQVLSGADGRVLYTFDGDSALDGFGFSVSSAGDVNGDGLADFIVGTERGGTNDGGYARVFVSQIREQVSDIDGSGTQPSFLYAGSQFYAMQPFTVTAALATADALEYSGAFATDPADLRNSDQTGLDVRTWDEGFIYFSTAADALNGTPTARAQFNPLESKAANGQLFEDLIIQETGPNGETHYDFIPVAELGTSLDGNPFHQLTEILSMDSTLTMQDDSTTTLGSFLEANVGANLYLSSVLSNDPDDGFYGIAGIFPVPEAEGIIFLSVRGGFEVEAEFSHRISAVATPLLGDVNLDETVTFADIPAFIAVLSGGGFQTEADCDENGEVNFADIPAFITILTSQ